MSADVSQQRPFADGVAGDPGAALDYLEELLALAEGGEEPAGALARLQPLRRRVSGRFAAEEQRMRELGHAAAQAHAEEHEALGRYLVCVEEEVLEAGDPRVLDLAARVLCNWILMHLGTFDRELAACVARRL